MGVIYPQPSLAADTAAHLGPAEREKKGLLRTAVGQKKRKGGLKTAESKESREELQHKTTVQNCKWLWLNQCRGLRAPGKTQSNEGHSALPTPVCSGRLLPEH